MYERKVFSGWAYITRADDVPGCWVAHCLDYGVMSLGDSPQQALDMVREAVWLTIVDDLKHGYNPSGRRAAPAEWEPLERLIERHTKVAVNGMDDTDFKEFAVPITILIKSDADAQLETGLELGSDLSTEAVASSEAA